MACEVITIANKIVSCYLIKTGDGFFMVDAGLPFSRGVIKKALKKAGCKPGRLKVVVITHGDYDHTANGAYLQKKYGAKIIIHKSEARAAEKGDSLSSRKTKAGKIFRFMLWLLKPLMFSKVKADIYIEGERDLTEWGIDAKIIHIPGHSMGSIGVVTKDGELFCGDLLNNSKTPKKNTLIDDVAEMDASIEKMKTLDIRTIYPGHGKPFTMEEFFKNNPR